MAELPRTYSAADVCFIAGIPAATLQNWLAEKREIVVLKGRATYPGKDADRVFGIGDVFTVATIAQLVKLGLPPREAKKFVPSAVQEMERQTAGVGGDARYECVLFIYPDPEKAGKFGFTRAFLNAETGMLVRSYGKGGEKPAMLPDVATAIVFRMTAHLLRVRRQMHTIYANRMGIPVHEVLAAEQRERVVEAPAKAKDLELDGAE